MNRLAAIAAISLVCCTGSVRGAHAAGLQANVTSTSAESLQEFQKLEDDWSKAVNARDQYGMELVLSPLFLDVAATGDITTRNQQVAYLLSAGDKTMHIEQKAVTVRMLGDTAVVNGTYVLHHQAGSGSVDDKGVFTHVFERARGRWVCVNSQRTQLREDAAGKRKKPSNAEQPFRIPLFSRGDKDKKDQ